MRAHQLLRTLESDLENFTALKNLQMLIIAEIANCERKIPPIKSEMKRLGNPAKNTYQRRHRFLSTRLNSIRKCIYVWRSFGDAIAFIYMNKHALKHSYYNTENCKVKPQSGFLSGKDGLRQEWSVVEKFLDEGIPALLVDITNTIRHGDVCLMPDHDPFLIEVKSSKTKDRRRIRQIKRLKKLHEFYNNDEATEMRGLPMIRRASVDVEEVDYIKDLNAAIRDSYHFNSSMISPETGLVYIVSRASGDIEAHMSKIAK